MLGVSYNDFWDMTPKELQPFVKAFSLKQELLDMEMWAMGSYIQLAVASTLSKSVKYPKKPLIRSSKIDETEDMRQRFMYRAEQLNSRFRRED